MELPVFKLEGIVKTKDDPQDFEGPLALILLLLSKNKAEIKDISISLILGQYLEYLETMAYLDLDIASEFITMASHLTLIKTKMLLYGDEEISELQQLINSLEELNRSDMYAQIKTAVQELTVMYFREGLMMESPPEYLPAGPPYNYSHNGDDLLEAVYRMIGREYALPGSRNPRAPVYPRRIDFTIPERIAEIIEKLKLRGDIPLSWLFFECGSRTELVATLIAVLELCRVGSVALMGGPDDLTIAYTGVGRDPVLIDFTEEQCCYN